MQGIYDQTNSVMTEAVKPIPRTLCSGTTKRYRRKTNHTSLNSKPLNNLGAQRSEFTKQVVTLSWKSYQTRPSNNFA